jgi:hypothetical protein
MAFLLLLRTALMLCIVKCVVAAVMPLYKGELSSVLRIGKSIVFGCIFSRVDGCCTVVSGKLSLPLTTVQHGSPGHRSVIPQHILPSITTHR